MRTSTLAFIAIALTLANISLSACGGSPVAPSTTPPLAAERRTPLTPADALARRVATSAGLAGFDQIAELRFRFVVTIEGERRMDAFHRWDVRGKRDRVTWNDGEHRYDVVVDLETRTATGTLDGAAVTGESAEAAGAAAHERWVNDSYWLLLPLKLLDPGVRRTRESARERDGRSFEILSLEFEHVGLTPGDHYWLYIDPATGRIARWDMVLEGQTEPPRAISFEGYQAVGPLMLALDHVTDDGKRHVLFEDVEALHEVDARDF